MEYIFGNSSTEEALVLFAAGASTFKQFYKDCWPKECKAAIIVLKNRGYKKSINAARQALKLRGWSSQ